jgi:hypothetical protein
MALRARRSRIRANADYPTLDSHPSERTAAAVSSITSTAQVRQLLFFWTNEVIVNQLTLRRWNPRLLDRCRVAGRWFASLDDG